MEKALSHFGIPGMHWGQRKAPSSRLEKQINKKISSYDKSTSKYEKVLTKGYQEMIKKGETSFPGKGKVAMAVGSVLLKSLKLGELDRKYKTQTGKSYVEKVIKENPKYNKMSLKKYLEGAGVNEHELLAKVKKEFETSNLKGGS